LLNHSNIGLLIIIKAKYSNLFYSKENNKKESVITNENLLTTDTSLSVKLSPTAMSSSANELTNNEGNENSINENAANETQPINKAPPTGESKLMYLSNYLFVLFFLF
jgi:hypothetical protein